MLPANPLTARLCHLPETHYKSTTGSVWSCRALALANLVDRKPRPECNAGICHHCRYSVLPILGYATVVQQLIQGRNNTAIGDLAERIRCVITDPSIPVLCRQY